MSAFNHVRDLNDAALKPRLLRVLLKNDLPSEDRPLSNPADIAFVVSTLKTHHLLSQQIPHDAPHKLASTWAAAVDSWVDRVSWLARCNLPDKCWAGVCLLGVTCIECSSERLLASFSDWCNILLSHIQSSGVSQIVRVASCAAVSDLLTRLGGFSDVKKDGTSLAGKLVQPILKILNEDATDELLEAAAHLLFTVLTNYPLSVQRYYDNVEAAIVSKIMSGNCSQDVLKELSCCLALLPNSRVDEKSWSLMMQKILLALNSLLDSALEGLEQESQRRKAIALLVPPGKDLPLPLGGQVIGGAFVTGERSQQSVISAILSLVQCCCTMLTKSYPVQVVVPVRPLLAIVGRVLMVNGSLSEALEAFTTAMQQELVCLQLPVLHKNVLDIIAALNKGLRSQILPHGAEIIWLLTMYLEKCRLPELRAKAYMIIKILLISMGAGMALYVSQDIVDNVLVDLSTDSSDNGKPSSKLSVEPSPRHHRKKRKHGKVSESSVEQHASDVQEPKDHYVSFPLKIAATEALEALLIVGGALMSIGWRGGVDHLLMEVATNACKGDWIHGGKPFLLGGSGPALEDFQLVALRALLASLLCPAGVRPPHLAQGLELFNRGKQNPGTKVAEFCTRSLMALEVLIHPRALSLIDELTTNSSGRMDFGRPKYKSPMVGSRVHGVYPDVYDVQDYANMEDGFEAEVPADEVPKIAVLDGKSLDVAMVQDDTDINDGGNPQEIPIEDKNPSFSLLSVGKETLHGRDERSEPTSTDNTIERNMDTTTLDTSRAEPETTSSALQPLSAQTKPANDASDSAIREPMSGVHVLAAKSTASAAGVRSEAADTTDVSASVNREAMSGMLIPSAKSTASTSNVGRGDAAMNEYLSFRRILYDDDESSDSLPDRVDADPDTDTDSGSDSDSV